MDEKNREHYEEIDLREVFILIKNNIALILVATIVFGIAGFFVTKYLITPQYEASVNMIVNTKQENTSAVSNDNITSAKNLVSTYAIIIKSNTVLNQVIDNLGLDIDYDTLQKKVTVTAVNDTQVMRVAVKDPDPYLAARIVRSISRVSPDVIVDSVEAGSCKVISQVDEPKTPVSPSITKNTSVAAILGLVISIAIVFVKYFFSNYIVDGDDVQKYLGIPVLGVIPETEA